MTAKPYVPSAAVINFLVECTIKMRSLPETQQRQSFRLAIMLLNKSPRALRLARMYDSGEISGGQLLSLMD